MNSEVKLKEAAQFEKQNKLLHALQLYEILSKKPEYKRIATVRLANIYEKLGKSPQAESVLNNYIEYCNDDEEIIKLFAHFLLRSGQFEKALDALSKVSTDKNPEIFFLMGVAHISIGDFTIAAINFKEFINQNKKSDLLPEAYLFLAKVYINLENYDEALVYAKRSELLHNHNAEMHNILSSIFYKKNMTAHAFEEIRKAIKLSSKNHEFYAMAGRILIGSRDYNKALNYLHEGLEFSKENAEIKQMIKSCSNALNLSEKSIEVLDILDISQK